MAIVPCAQCRGVMDAVAVDALPKRAIAGEALKAKKEIPRMQIKRIPLSKNKGRRFFFLGGVEGFARFARVS